MTEQLQTVTVKKSHHKSSAFKQHTLEEEPEVTPTVTWIGAFLLGVAMKLGGCTVGWSMGFIIGFGEYSLSLLVIGMAYLCLALCMAEMTSIMSFAGGYYGYARCAIGPFAGYIVGCCGIFESTFSMAISILKFGQFITQAFGTSYDLEPAWWIMTFSVIIFCHYLGGKWFWSWISVAAVVGLLLIFVYLFGSMPALDFNKYAHPTYFSDNYENFFAVFRFCIVFFMGFDMLTMTSSEVINSKVNIPKAMLTLICFLLILSIWLMITVASQAPGISPTLYKVTTMYPLAFGYEQMFGISHQAALCICVIPTFATPLGYMYVVGKQMNSMAKSGLLPPIFKYTVGEARVPIFGMIAVSILAILGLLYAWAVNPYTTTSRFCTFGGCIVYISMFVCYIIFNARFSNLERTFRNPLGIVSAVIGIIIFAFIFVVLICMNTEYYQVTALNFGFLFLMTVYYYAYAETHQFFSASEQKVFFKAYIVNMKRRKKQNFIQRIWHDCTKAICASLCWMNGNSNHSSRSKVYSSGSTTAGNGENSNNRLSSNSGGNSEDECSSSYNYSTSNHHTVTAGGRNSITISPGRSCKHTNGGGLSGFLLSAVTISTSKGIAAVVPVDNSITEQEQQQPEEQPHQQLELQQEEAGGEVSVKKSIRQLVVACGNDDDDDEDDDLEAQQHQQEDAEDDDHHPEEEEEIEAQQQQRRNSVNNNNNNIVSFSSMISNAYSSLKKKNPSSEIA